MDTDLEAPVGWIVADDGLVREFVFRDFREAFQFLTGVALEAEKADHHPDWANSYNRVRIALRTHSEGRITAKDIHLAERIQTVAHRFV